MRIAPLLVLAALGCQRHDDPPQAGPPAAPAAPEAPEAHDAPRPPAPPLPDPLPGTRKDVTALVGSAYRAAIGDLAGDGKREIVLADATKLRVVDPRTGRELASTAAPGGANILVALDVDGDHHPEIVVGWGTSRDHRDAPARVVMYRLDKEHLVEETLFAPDTSRAEIVAILPWETNALLVAYFESKYLVRSVVLRRGAKGWEPTQLASLRTATSYARGDIDGDGKPELVVGRVYGDAKGVDGDAFLLGPDGKRDAIPTTRGVRSIAVVDGEIYLGDGWHQNYAQLAHGLLTWAHHTSSGFRSELIEDMPGQYAIERIAPAKIDDRTILVTSGSQYVRVFARASDRWTGLTIAGAARDIAVGDLDGIAGDEILIVGDRSEIVSLRGIWAR